MGIYWHNGKLLWSGGKLALSADCCCGSCPCRLPPDASEMFDITFGTADPVGCPTGTHTLTWIGPPSNKWTFGNCICDCVSPGDYWVMELECIDGVWVLYVAVTWDGNTYVATVDLTCSQSNPAILTGTILFTGLPLDYVGSETLAVTFTLSEVV